MTIFIFPGSRQVEDVPFTGVPAIHPSLNKDSGILDFFFSMFPLSSVEQLTVETNRFANQVMRNDPLKLRKWKDVTVTCMRAFLGIVILMGLVRKSNLKDYWTCDAVIDTPYIRKVMSRDRFFEIMRYLHFNDNEKALPSNDPNRDKLFKIRPMYDVIRANFAKMCTPSRDVAIDEASIPWKGNLSFKVFNPLKPHKHHVKAYEMCDSKTGYCHYIEIYSGKVPASSKGSTYDLIFRIMDPHLDLGHRLFLDNFYTSPQLVQDLFQRKTGVCGTLRTNRKGTPQEIKSVKLDKGEWKAMHLKDGGIQLIKWKDKRDVNVISSIHNADFVECPVKGDPGKTKLKPKAVIDYNKGMGAVDLSDQLATYEAFIHAFLKWYKKVGFHLINLCIVNAYILYKRLNEKPKSHSKFRRTLAKELCEPHIRENATRHVQGPFLETARLYERHFPSEIPMKRRRNCIVCSQVKPRKTSIECKAQGCNVALCITPCFEIYHTKSDYRRAYREKMARPE